MTAVRRLVATAVLGAGLAAVPLAAAPPAAALSCVPPAHVLRDAEQVFTGRIVEVEDGTAVVAVEEVWRGGPVEAETTVALGLPEWWGGDVAEGRPNTERLWVFAPYDERGTATVNPCTAWDRGTPGVGRSEPDQVSAPVSSAVGTAGTDWWSRVVGAVRAGLPAAA